MKTLSYIKHYYALYFTDLRYILLGIFCLPILCVVIFIGIAQDTITFIENTLNKIIRF